MVEVKVELSYFPVHPRMFHSTGLWEACRLIAFMPFSRSAMPRGGIWGSCSSEMSGQENAL